MTTKFTPGPWYVFHSAHRGRFDDDGPGAFSIGDAPTARSANILCSRYEWPERAEEMKANARLIAAAPDLLDELLDVLDWAVTERAPLRNQEIESIRKVIARATGEQP